MTMAEARERVDEAMKQLPGVHEEVVLATMQRLARGAWTIDDVVAICRWRANK